MSRRARVTPGQAGLYVRDDDVLNPVRSSAGGVRAGASMCRSVGRFAARALQAGEI